MRFSSKHDVAGTSLALRAHKDALSVVSRSSAGLRDSQKIFWELRTLRSPISSPWFCCQVVNPTDAVNGIRREVFKMIGEGQDRCLTKSFHF